MGRNDILPNIPSKSFNIKNFKEKKFFLTNIEY